MVTSLLQSGSNAQAPNRYGATPMFLAALNGSAAMIETLLKAGADPNAPVLSRGETALMMAARTGKANAVEMLLHHGAKVNATEELRGTTALMWAAEQGHAEIMRLLIDSGADVSIQSKVVRPIRRNGLGFARGPGGQPSGDPMGGLTALLFAAREGFLDAARILIDHGANARDAA